MDLFYIDKTGSDNSQCYKVNDEVEKMLENYKASIKRGSGSTEQPNFLERCKVDSKLNIGKLLKKSVITSDFETLQQVPCYEVSNRQKKKQKLLEREKSKGKKWYGLPATELTEEVKNDLEVLKMRSVLNPKQFYKKNDLQVLPRYFQIGRVLDHPLDYYHDRLTKKERKRTLVDELLQDAEFNKYQKRKYKEIMEEKQKSLFRAYRKVKKQKKGSFNKFV